MITLYDYILEAAVGNLGLTVDDLSKYIDTIILIDGKPTDYTYKDKIYAAFVGKLGDKQGDKAFKAFDRYVDSFINTVSSYNIEIDDNILKLLYDKLTNMDARKIERLLGVGMEASAIELGDDKVLKMYFGGHLPFDRKNFFEMCKKGECRYFPKVYRVGKGYVVMEKLKTHTPHCEKFIEAMNSNRFGDSIYHLVQDDKVHKIKGKFYPIELEVINFMEGIRPYLDKVGFEPNYYGDLGIDNIGEREDGTIVFFDI